MLNWEVAASERCDGRTGRDVDLVGLPTDVHDGGTEGELSIEQDGEEGARGAVSIVAVAEEYRPGCTNAWISQLISGPDSK